MMTVDISKIKIGDTVTIRASVTYSQHGELRIDLGGCRIPLQEDEIVTHTPKPRPIEVGDRVRHRDDLGVFGTIVCIADEEAWLRYNGGGHCTYRLENLVRDQ